MSAADLRVDREWFMEKHVVMLQSDQPMKETVVEAKETETFAIVYTQDKQKKQNRRWLDGTMQLMNGVATFYDEQGKIIHRKSDYEHSEETLETPRYIIEVTGGAARDSASGVKTVGFYEALFTKDKHKKNGNRKWFDGYLEVSVDKLIFRDEEHHIIHTRKIQPLGEELETAEFLFQIGERLSGKPVYGEEENLEIPLEWVCPEAKALKERKRVVITAKAEIKKVKVEHKLEQDASGRSLDEIARLLNNQ